MKNMIFRKFTIVLISLLFVFYPIRILNGCGGGEMAFPEDDFHFILNQELLSASGYEPFFLYYSDSFYPYEDTLQGKQNINEWYEYFGKKISEENVTALVYSYSHSELQGILNHIQKGHKSNVAKDVLAYFNQTKNADVINYLLFVRDIQPNVEGLNQWEGCAHDLASAESFFVTGEQLLKRSKSDFLKVRIAYQLARLAHYGGDYQKCITYYDNYIQTSNVNSCIKYWALGHKAGSLKVLGKLPEATYLFSVVFANSPDKRNQAFKSIWFSGEAYEEAFQFCKNEEEKQTLLFMNALEHSGPYMQGLLSLYELKPASKELEVLVMREVKKMETYFTNSEFAYGSYDGTDNDSQEDLEHVTVLKEFVLKGASKGRSPALWNFLAGYLSYLTKDYGESIKFMDLANSLAKDDVKMQNEARIIKTIIAIDSRDTIDSKFEGKVLEEFNWLNKMNAPQTSIRSTTGFSKARNYYLERLMLKYKNNGEGMKSVLCQNAITSIQLEYSMNEETVDAFISFLNKKNKDPMELFLGNHFGYDMTRLNEMKGMLVLRRGAFKSAVQYLKKTNIESLSAGDPFEFKINNCISCDDENPDIKRYSKLAFAEKMLEYEMLAKKDKVKAANYYFMIGLGLFNTTYYGSSWNLMDYHRGYGDIAHRDCSKSLEYFEKVMALTKDKELAAKACYMAAKCQQNNSDDVLNGSNEYFEVLRQNFADTKYYEEVIKECSYFNYFVKNM